jgi:protein-S-isoprenylcysteine O-methyltransferase Ste14
MLVCLFVVHRIFNSTRLGRRDSMTDSKLFQVLGAILFVFVGYLILWTVSSAPVAISVTITTASGFELYTQCSSPISFLPAGILVIEM